MSKFVRFSLISIFLFFTLIALAQKVFASQKVFPWFETKTKKTAVSQPVKLSKNINKLSPTSTPIPTSTPKIIPTATSITITPTSKPFPTAIPTIIPTSMSTPTPTPQPPQPTTAPTSPPSVSVDDPISYIMNAINNYRMSNGLSTVNPDPNTCNFARTRVGEIVNDFNHNGFYNRVNSNSLPYPGFSEVTENIARVDDYKKVVDMWINSPTHAANMLKNTPYVCVAQNGYFYAYEGWKP